MTGQEPNPTHAQLADSIRKVHGRIDDLSLTIGAQHGQLNTALTDLSVAVAGLSAKVEAGSKISAENQADLKSMGNRLHGVELANAVRAGKEGAFAAIMKSPALAWVLALAVAAWTYLKSAVPGS